LCGSTGKQPAIGNNIYFRTLGIRQSGIFLISGEEDDFYQQHMVDGGYLILIHSSAEQKKNHIEFISKQLDLGIKVKIFTSNM
jgi:hypothetical protein